MIAKTNSAPKMPDAYMGEYKKSGGYTKSTPREWTNAELEWVKELQQQNYNVDQIAESIGRTKTSVSIKLKRMSKKDRTYADGHIEEKYAINQMFLLMLKPDSVLDVYSGKTSWYDGRVKSLTSNDKMQDSKTDYHMDALRCICYLYQKKKKYDLIDLDPFGSAYDLFDIAIKMCRKGLVITFGELGHKRWNRVDYVSTHYGITEKDEITLNNMIAHVQMIGRRNKKILTPVFQKEWRNIGRAWFLVEDYKVTTQWENKSIDAKKIFDGDIKCTACGNDITNGCYYIKNGEEIFCGDDCLYSFYSSNEYESLCEKNEALWIEQGD